MLSKDQFAEMNARLDETERREQALMQSLRDRLTAVDQKLLEDVRNIGLEHEGRRTMILTELQSLAERVGAFPAQRPVQRVAGEGEPLAAPRHVPQPPSRPNAMPPVQSASAPVHTQRTQGDWRAAAERIRQDIESKLSASPAQHIDPWDDVDAAPSHPI